MMMFVRHFAAPPGYLIVLSERSVTMRALLRFTLLLTMAILLSGCLITSEEALYSVGDDVGISVTRLGVLNETIDDDLPVLTLLERKGTHYQTLNVHFLESILKGKSGLDSTDEMQALFKRLPGYPDHYIAQVQLKGEDFFYSLVTRQGSRLHVSLMLLTEEEREFAEGSGLHVPEFTLGFFFDNAAQLQEYARYWLELKGSQWYLAPRSIDQKSMLFSGDIVEGEENIAAAKAATLEFGCLAKAGHPGDPAVKALAPPHNRGKLLIAIESEQAIALCERSSTQAGASQSARYALARAYERAGIYQPANGVPGSLAIARELAEEGFGLGFVMQAAAYTSGKGVEKDPERALQLLKEQAPQTDANVLQTLGTLYFYDYLGAPNYPLSLQYTTAAADLGSSEALATLGNMYQLGLGVEQSHATALEYFVQSAAGGSSRGRHLLGMAYYNGYGVDKNLQRAFTNIEQAAQTGFPAAMYAVGYMSAYGQGTKESRYTALNWLRKAARADHARAKKLAAQLYYEDPAQALKDDEYESWLVQSATEGDAHSQYLLGWLYESGRDQKPDEYHVYSLNWYRKAAAQGYVDAQLACGRLYLVQKNYDKALSFYESAVEQKNGRAAWQMGELYFEGRGHSGMSAGIPRDIKRATGYYEAAADQGIALGLVRLAMAYISGHQVAKDVSRAALYMSRAAEMGDPEAQRALGSMYMEGTGVPKNTARGFQWLEKAADQGESVAQFSLGVMYEQGTFVAQDYGTALDWYNKSAAKDYPRAWNNLGHLVEKGHRTKQDYAKAIQLYQLAAAEGVGIAHGNLARVLATVVGYKDPDKATMHAREAIKLNDKAYNHELLAAAYAANGRFSDAIVEQATAIAKAEGESRPSPNRDLRLSIYRRGKELNCFAGGEKGCF
ncbi:sel1 repeat family protein [Halieaceae bacterium IMCC14734]|uniref:Sel1 repeat family protein n=1 Tax=Candidatus Litorirhabdus singularis TaxID=2518993 RepID=A0ABT3TNH2_9GAMM|nr:tetratricopeptide repeat protein [Candidatus Litorirhabdus singularis]MCX2983315.1 sel1 repeat family protein [Candidatus Litorirhabdus singularis]